MAWRPPTTRWCRRLHWSFTYSSGSGAGNAESGATGGTAAQPGGNPSATGPPATPPPDGKTNTTR